MKPYSDSKKLSLDDWLMSVKHGQRGDIMLVYILSIMKGLHTCIHLKNGKTWSTLRAIPIHHMELMHRCDIHLAYYSFGIYLQLVKRPLPISQHIVLGTIQCDNQEVLNKLLLGKQELLKKKHEKKAVSATAGSQADLPRVQQDLRIDTSTRRLHKNSSNTQEPSACQTITLPTRSAPTTTTLGQKSCKSSVNPDLPFSSLTSTTDKVTTLTTPKDTSLPGITASALPGTSSLKSEKPDHNVLVPLTPSTGQVRKHNLRKCLVSISRLTTADIMKYTRASMVKPLSIVLHKLPLNPSQIVRVVSPKATVTHLKDPTSTKHTDRWHKVPKRKISGHPQSNKHVFHVKHHILCKRTRKLYLKCRIINCKQAFRSFHNVQALNVHHHIFHPRILFRCRICPKIHHTPSSDWYHKYEHQQPTYPAQDVTNLLYLIASYSSIEGRISNRDCTGASTAAAPKAIGTHKT